MGGNRQLTREEAHTVKKLVKRCWPYYSSGSKNKISVSTQYTGLSKIVLILSAVRNRACYLRNGVILGSEWGRHSVMHAEKYKKC